MMSHAQTRRILEAVGAGILTADAEGRILFVNHMGRRLLGADAALPGRPAAEVLPEAAGVLGECLADGRTRCCRADLPGGPVLVDAAPVHEDGRVGGLVCLLSPEPRPMELDTELLLRRNRYLESVFQNIPDIVWLYDRDGRVLAINRAAERVNRITAADVVGKHYSEVVAMGVIARSVVPDVLTAGRQVSIVAYSNSGRTTDLVTGTPIEDASGTIDLILVTVRDMTQLNSLKERMEESRSITEAARSELSALGLLELRQHDFVAESEEMRQVLRVALKLASVGASNILITGESGTGKGLLAKFIHQNSPRREEPFVQINCAAVPESLLEAELFGYERGAFTGAGEEGKAGLFELAHSGTLFLDEIGDMPLALQAKILKYLDDKEVRRLGGTKVRTVDCSIIAATNRDLEDLTREGVFREDLFYRLTTFTVRIPPLRRRPEDLFALVNYYVSKYNELYKQGRRVTAAGMEALQSYSFPGNVRELRNILEKAVVLSEEDILDRAILAGFGRWLDRGESRTLKEELDRVEKEILNRSLLRHRTTRAMAADLGLDQSTVVRKLRKHGLGD